MQLSNNVSLVVHAIALIGIYAAYGVLQERIMKGTYGSDSSRFTSASLLVLFNRAFSLIVGIALLLYKRRSLPGSTLSHLKPASPIPSYMAVAGSNFVSTYCQYQALTYVGFTTQALAKCAKVVPVLFIGATIYKQQYAARQWMSAGVIFLGCVVYLLGTAPNSSAIDSSSLYENSMGALLLCGYLFFDGLTSTTQERMFGKAKSSAEPFSSSSPVLDQMVWVNMLAIVVSICGSILAWTATKPSLQLLAASVPLARDILLLSATATFGLITLLSTIAVFGALTSSTIMTVRQFLSILINAGVFGNLSTIGVQGFTGIGWVAAGIFIKLDPRASDDAPRDYAKCSTSSPDPDSEKGGLLGTSTIDDSQDSDWRTNSQRRSQTIRAIQLYAPPILAPVVVAFVLYAAMHVLGGIHGNNSTSSSELQLEGGIWSKQLYAAVAPRCAEYEVPVRHPNQAAIPRTALASFHRSGNTYTRELVERLTGYRTNAIYCDPGLHKFFAGECDLTDKFLQKTHYPTERGPADMINNDLHWTRYDQVVHVIRNPIDAIASNYNWRRTRSHDKQMNVTTFPDSDWDFIATLADRWNGHARYWVGVPLKTLPLRYEDLRSHTLPNLMNLASFLLPDEELPSIGKLACTLEMDEHQAYKSRRVQPFAAWDYFSDDMRAKIFPMVKEAWCRFGYDVLLKKYRPDEVSPIDCKTDVSLGLNLPFHLWPAK